MVALRFFASGSYQMDIGKNLFVAVSQSTVSRCIEEVTFALNEPVIFNEWVHFPRNFEELNALRLKYVIYNSLLIKMLRDYIIFCRFYEDFNIPGVVGCIDCTHVAIFTPKIDDEEYPEHLYVNRKGYHSINAQLVSCYIFMYYV